MEKFFFFFALACVRLPYSQPKNNKAVTVSVVIFFWRVFSAITRQVYIGPGMFRATPLSHCKLLAGSFVFLFLTYVVPSPSFLCHVESATNESLSRQIAVYLLARHNAAATPVIARSPRRLSLRLPLRCLADNPLPPRRLSPKYVSRPFPLSQTIAHLSNVIIVQTLSSPAKNTASLST